MNNLTMRTSYRLPVQRLIRLSALALVPMWIAACGSGSTGDGGGQPPPAYTVGGSINGLSGTVVLRNNGGDDLSVGSNGAFQFGTAIPSGGAYNITVKTQPTNQTCALSGGGSGVVGTSNITSVVVTCTNNPANTYTVGGAVAGLTGTLVLTNTRGANAIDDLSITANGGFTFPTAIATNGTYAVAVKTQPAGQTCVVANDHGTIGVANVTNVLITCAANPPNALQADAGVHSATLTWTAPIGFGGTSFNVYVSSARHCDIGHYAACPDGAMLTNVVSPQTVTNLRNGQAYFFQLESVFANGVRAISTEVGARPNAISFNGIVSAIAPAANGTVYVGGSFTQVGVTTGAAIPLDVVTGRLAAPDFPIVDGSVNAVAADGVGGWYIGGSFSSVGGISRENLAHVRSDGTVDPAWAPAADEIVNAIVVSGNTVYVGGGFGRIGTDFRTHPAAIDAVTGVTRSWNPVANGVVYALAVSGNTVYVGGFFDHIGPDARNRDRIDVTLPSSMTSRPSLVPTQMRLCRSSMSAVTVSPDRPLCRLNEVVPDGSSR